MKYIIEFEDEYSMNEGGMKYHQCKQVPYWSVSNGIIKNLTPYTEPDRKSIEDEVWKFLVFLIDEMDVDDKYNCFNQSSAYRIASTMSYKEAKSKYEAWMKQKDVIHVGDEVTFEMAFGNGLDNNMKAVALDQAATGEEWCVLTENGCIETHDEEDLYKTGRYFPEVTELLRKMRGGEE